MKTVSSDRLRAARVLRYRKSGEVAELLQWTPSKYTRAEQGQGLTVTDEQFELLQTYLDFPAGFLTAPPPPALAPSELLFKTPKSTSVAERRYLAEFARVSGEVVQWLDDRHRLPPPRLPMLPVTTHVVDAARSVRDALAVGPSTPIPDLMLRVERAGVPVIIRGHKPDEHIEDRGSQTDDSSPRERHQGYSAFVGEHRERPLILIRGGLSWERTRWVTGHEVGHVVLHGGLTNVLDAHEDQASLFSSELLAPIDVLRDELPRHITLAGLVSVKMRWGISLGALIRHLHSNELVDATRKETLQSQLYRRVNPATGHTWSRYEPGHDERQVESPKLLRTWAERTLRTAAPGALAAMSQMWPADVFQALVGTLNEGADRQVRSRSKAHPGTPASGTETVVSLASWRKRAI